MSGGGEECGQQSGVGDGDGDKGGGEEQLVMEKVKGRMVLKAMRIGAGLEAEGRGVVSGGGPGLGHAHSSSWATPT